MGNDPSVPIKVSASVHRSPAPASRPIDAAVGAAGCASRSASDALEPDLSPERDVLARAHRGVCPAAHGLLEDDAGVLHCHQPAGPLVEAPVHPAWTTAVRPQYRDISASNPIPRLSRFSSRVSRISSRDLTRTTSPAGGRAPGRRGCAPVRREAPREATTEPQPLRHLAAATLCTRLNAATNTARTTKRMPALPRRTSSTKWDTSLTGSRSGAARRISVAWHAYRSRRPRTFLAGC